MPSTRHPRLIHTAPIGRIHEFQPPFPDRTARVDGPGIGDDVRIYQFPSRTALARTIRRDEESAPSSRFIPLVKLEATEGF